MLIARWTQLKRQHVGAKWHLNTCRLLLSRKRSGLADAMACLLEERRKQTVIWRLQGDRLCVNKDGSLAVLVFFSPPCLLRAVNFWPKGNRRCLSLPSCVCVCVLQGQMVFVWAASDKACINLVKIARAGGAAGGSWWCLPAKRLTYVPGLKETIVIRWWVGGAAACFGPLLSGFLSVSEHILYIERVDWLACSCTVYWSDIKRWTFESATGSSRAQVVVWKSSRAGRQLLSATSFRLWIILCKMWKFFHYFHTFD